MNNVDLIKYMLKRSDLQINVRDNHGKSVLHYACYHLRDTIVDVLLDHPDIDVNAIDDSNDTTLHKVLKTCVCKTDIEFNMIQKLLEHPFTIIDLKNNDNKTPLDLLKARLNYFENNTINPHYSTSQEDQIRYVKLMIHLFEEFSIKQRYQAYCYHLQELFATA